jgi:gag-polypeptide of LTR copia-type
MSNDERHARSITLKPLKPDEYRIWAVQAEASFEVHNCLEIVLGHEEKPSKAQDEAQDLFAAHLTRKSWITRHARAREALLKALDASDLHKILPIKDSASAIWNRLKEEYGKSLDFEYIRVNSEFQSLRKDSKTTIDHHINRFNMLLQAVNYNKPPEIPELTTAAINLYFLQSLGSDWEVWGMTKGLTLRTTPTAELMAEVRALSLRNQTSSLPQPSTTPTSQDISVNTAQANDVNSNTKRNGKWNHKRNNNRGRSSNSQHGKNNGKRRSSHDPNKYCPLYQTVGHNIFECRKAKQEKLGRSKNNAKSNGNGGYRSRQDRSDSYNDGHRSRQDRSESYKPNFAYPSYL